MEPKTYISDLKELPIVKDTLRKIHPDIDILIINLSDKHDLI